MRIFLLLILSFFGVTSAFAVSAFNQIQESLTIETTPGNSQRLDRDSFIRQINVTENLGRWYAEIRLVDDENRPISNEVYRVSRKYLNVAIGVMFMDSLTLYDELGNEEGSIPGGINIVRLGEGTFPWPHYLLSLTDDDGNPIHVDGTPWDARSGDPYPVYKVHKRSFEAKLLDNKIRELIFITEQEKGIVEGANCIPPEPQGNPTGLGAIRPVARPPNLGNRSPYEAVLSHREELKGRNDCTTRRRNIENELLRGSEWEGLSLHQKADKVYQLAKDVRQEIINVSNSSGRNVRGDSRFANSVNPHYFPDSGIKPELVACIVFQETEGHLNFTSHNTTYCSNTNNPSSTAHGLTQFTRTTFRMMKRHPEGDQAPFNTRYSRPLEGMSAHNAHREMSRYPGAQIEMAYRLLNHEYKRAYVNSPNKTRTQLLRDAVLAYDKDNQSEYLSNVMDKCLPCMNTAGNNGRDCYSEVYE